MALDCIDCGEEIDPNRACLGYRRCLSCGETVAQQVAQERASRCVPSYNKGPLQPLSSDPRTARRQLLDAGLKTGKSLEGED